MTIAILIFFILLICHIIIWRLKIPNSPKKILFLLLLTGNVFLIPCIILFNNFDIFEMLYLLIFYNTLVLLYIFVIYMQVEGDSPTLLIIRFIGDSKKGKKRMEIMAEFANKPFFETRFNELLDDESIKIVDDSIILNKENGIVVIVLFVNTLRNFLGLVDTRG